MEIKNSRPATAGRLLGVQKSLDIVFDAGHFGLCPDVRNAAVLGMNSRFIAVAQPSPPILKSMVNKSIEASFIDYDPISAERIRWGWNSQIIGLSNNYTADNASLNGSPAQAVFIAMPCNGALQPTNVRFDYRLTVTDQDGILVKTSPGAYGAKLWNFSAGGVQISVPGLPVMQAGIMMQVSIIFPWPEKNSRASIKCLAEVMWMDYRSDERNTRLGLRFKDMEMETRRTFNKIIHHYMLSEQRLRQAAP